MYYSTTYPSPVGLLTLACDGDNLVGLWMEGQKYHGGSIPEAMTEKDDKLLELEGVDLTSLFVPQRGTAI